MSIGQFESRLAPTHQNGDQGTDHQLDVSIVMPCLNEAEALSVCVEEATSALARMGLTGEVVVVDNGSEDGSVAVAVAAGARVVHEAERGYGNACRTGLREARGRFLVLGDADGTYDFTALPIFVAPLFNGADMVVGNRLNDSMEAGAMPWLHRHVGNPFLTWAMNTMFSSDIADAHCGLRSIKREALEHLSLSTPGMEFASEFLVEAMGQGVRIEQVPIRYRRRHGGEPKLRTFRDGLRHLRLLLLLWIRTRREPKRGRPFPAPRSSVLGEVDLTERGEFDADRLRL